jgi:hypothetical protein
MARIVVGISRSREFFDGGVINYYEILEFNFKICRFA